MLSALKLKTKVLSGGRIEVSAPELVEGEGVELIVLRPEATAALLPISLKQPTYSKAGDYLASLPPIYRTPDEGVIIERELRE